MNIRDQVIQIAKTELGEAAPDETAPLADSLDSLQRLQLVVAIEDHFEICFEPEDDDAVHTLDDVARVVTKRLADGA